MKPNIFNYAKSELTNDAIICWMLDWTNSEHEIYKIIFSTKCLEEIKCQLTEGEVYTNV